MAHLGPAELVFRSSLHVLGLFMKSVSAMYSFGENGTRPLSISEIKSGACTFLFFSFLLDSSILSSIRFVLYCDRRWRNLLVLISFDLRGLGSLVASL